MTELGPLQEFLRDEDGAVTVDWVVLSAAVIGIAVSGMAAVRNATGAMTEDIATRTSDVKVGDSE